MKNFLIILIALIIGAGGGYLAWKYLFVRAESNSTGGRHVTAENYQEPFMWGITMRPSSLGKYIDEIWQRQIDFTTLLGLKYVRLGWSYDAPDQFQFNDEVINYLKKNGLDVYLVIEPSTKFEDVQNPYRDGYDNAFKIASHYKGQIKYYQIMNEASGNALKGGEYSGEQESDYNPQKYERTKEWIRGATEAVKKADPQAYRIVTAQWVNVGFLDMLQKDNIDYDIIGWDWFSDMGLMGEKKLSDGTLLIDKLKSYDKPLILAEINYRPEGENGQKGQPEAKQAAFIQKMADWAWANGLKGFLVLELLDSPNSGKGYTDYYGIVAAEQKKSGTWVPGDPRQAFSTYRDIIAKYSQ